MTNVTLENKINRYDESFDAPADCLVYDIKADGEIVGSMTVYDFHDEDYAYLERIDVDECRRGHGIGTAAINAAAEIVGKTLRICPDNADAARLYDRIGYECRDQNWIDYMDQGFGVYEV